jgi:aminoglycoside/choline kinase family phosphotransferase
MGGDELLDRSRARFGLPSARLAPAFRLAGDAGGRRYYRVETHAGATILVVLYPEPRTQAQANWASIGAALAAAGLRVPVLHDDEPEIGAALEEDLGDRDLAAEIADAPREEKARLLNEAEDLLFAVRSVSHAAATRNPPFDAAFFFKELAHTRLWAFEEGGGAPLPPDRAALWDLLAGQLAHAAADPTATGDPVPTHRDYHANNLMRGPDGLLAAIDFQDLRLGPPDYDPVSLRFERAGETVENDATLYREAVLLQRAWKVLGTFEKMLRLGRPVYQPHRETALRVIRQHTPKGGPFAPLLAFLS